MSSPLRKSLYWVGILVGGGLFLNQAWRGYQSISSKSLGIANPWELIVSAGFIISAMGIQIAAWRIMMANLGTSLTGREVLESYVLSFLPRYIPGSVWGYVSRAEWLKQSHGTPYTISNLGSMLEIVLIFTGIGLVSGIYLFETLAGSIKWVLLSLFFSIPLIGWLAIKWGLTSSVFNFLPGKISVSNSFKIFPIRVWLELCALHGFTWVLYGTSVYWIVKLISPDFPVALVDTTFLFAISWLLGFIVPFVPSGLGIREQSLSTLLNSVIFLSPGYASGVAVLSRLLSLSGELVWLVIGVLLKRFSAR